MFSVVLDTFSSWHMLAFKRALNACTMNSSATLNTFAVLSTCVRLIVSRMLHSEPTCEGAPQNIWNRTRRHSHRKWKSPIYYYMFTAIIFFFFPLSIGILDLPGVSFTQVSLSLMSGSDSLHSLHPRITLQVSWSPTTTFN